MNKRGDVGLVTMLVIMGLIILVHEVRLQKQERVVEVLLEGDRLDDYVKEYVKP